jgi:hypothetical protein
MAPTFLLKRVKLKPNREIIDLVGHQDPIFIGRTPDIEHAWGGSLPA